MTNKELQNKLISLVPKYLSCLNDLKIPSFELSPAYFLSEIMFKEGEWIVEETDKYLYLALGDITWFVPLDIHTNEELYKILYQLVEEGKTPCWYFDNDLEVEEKVKNAFPFFLFSEFIISKETFSFSGKKYATMRNIINRINKKFPNIITCEGVNVEQASYVDNLWKEWKTLREPESEILGGNSFIEAVRLSSLYPDLIKTYSYYNGDDIMGIAVISKITNDTWARCYIRTLPYIPDLSLYIWKDLFKIMPEDFENDSCDETPTKYSSLKYILGDKQLRFYSLKKRNF